MCLQCVCNCYDTLIGAANINNNQKRPKLHGSLSHLADARKSPIVICQMIDKSIRHLLQYCETHKSIKNNLVRFALWAIVYFQRAKYLKIV